MATAKYYGTGRRKHSVARVYLVPGTGKITINKRDIDEYLGLETLKVVVRQPLVATDTIDKYDVLVNVHGGGFTGQAGAIRHGISRALLQVDGEFRSTLKKAGFLTRDPRMKERNQVFAKHVVHHSSQNVNSTEYRKRATNPENPVFSGFSLYSENLSNILKTHENLSVTNTQLTGN